MVSRLPLGALLLLASSVAASNGRQGTPAPVSLHAANAAEAAEVAAQAAAVATRVAAHTQDVAQDTADALRYTRHALRLANADENDIAEMGRQADSLERESGVASGRAQSASGSSGRADSHLEGDLDRRQNGAGGAEGASRITSGVGDAGGASRSTSGVGGAGGASRITSGVGDGRITSEVGDVGDTPKPLDVDGAVEPYPSGAEPFGQEAPGKELTKKSVAESDGMIERIESAQGVEAKRAVYRALTKLRGATIASYDGIAKGHLKNVHQYNEGKKWRHTNPIRHLAEEEDDVHVWAFPKKNQVSPPVYITHSV